MGYFNDPGRFNRFREEVLKEKESYLVLRETVREILKDDNYDAIHDFFNNILNSEYHYVFLMSRRCLVLCQIFIAFLILDEELSDSETVVLSDQAIPYYRNKMEGCKVAIVDDILIHGRTVSNIYYLLKRYCKTTEPDIHVFMADTDIDCLRDEVRKAMDPECMAYKGEWRNLSNKIVRCIYASNAPYTSFVTAFSQYKSQKPGIYEQLKGIDTLCIEENTELTQKNCGLHSYYCYMEDKSGRPPLYESLSLGECIRIYWNTKISKLMVIPYVFVRLLSLEQAQNVFKEITGSLPDGMNRIKKAFRNMGEGLEDRNRLIEFKMRLLTCIMSILYWKGFTEKYHIRGPYYIDLDTLDKSFGTEITDELHMLLKERDFGKLSRVNINISYVEVKAHSDLKAVLNSVCSNVRENGCRNIMQGYFQKAWFLDEYLAKQGKERLFGLPLEKFTVCAKSHKVSEPIMFMNLVNTWDTGVSAANFAVSEQEQYVACFNTAGEQSYKITLEKYPFLMSSLIFVSKIIRKCDAGQDVTDEEYEKYKVEKLIDLLDTFHREHLLEDYDDIKEIIVQEKGYLTSWNQSGVIREYMERDKHRDEKLVRDYIEQKL